MKVDIRIRLLVKDGVYKLLFLNMLWVILGYALGTSQGLDIVPVIRIFKIGFVIISLAYVLYKNNLSSALLVNSGWMYTIMVAITFLSLFSDTPLEAFYKGITFVYPLIYLIYSINHLLRYGAINLLVSLSFMILAVYAVVPLSFYLVGGSLDQNIYGYTEGDYFVSNHYGWGSSIFILSAFTLLRYYPLKMYQRIGIYLFLPMSFYLLIISVNRAGILSIIIAFVLFFFRDKRSSIANKSLLLLVSMTIVMIIFFQENSAIEYLSEKNATQMETGYEGRLIGTNAMLRSFEQNPIYWLSGVGMFNYNELKLNGGILGAYHNSYWEVLFGGGIIVFLIFLKFMLFQPFRIFWRITSDYSLLIIPLILIPFFEGNLTAGQFLFFPWFSYMILLNAKEFMFYSVKRTNK